MVFDSVETKTDPLYSTVQRIILKNNSKEERSRELRVSVNFSNGHSKVSKQVLKIEVSDDDDPFFFYSLILTEDDYQRLRQSQGLLVDFESFPSQVIRLLEQCKDDSQSSKFLILLEEDKNSVVEGTRTCLKLVETNNFKHLCHLILQIEPGNDSDIKKLMLQKIKSLKEQQQKAVKCISELEAQLFTKSKQLTAKEEELECIHEKWKEDRFAYKAQSSKELNEETEKLRKAQLEWQIKEQRERNELEDKYSALVKEKDSEISRLHLENQILLEKRSHSDMTISEQANKIDILEKELSKLRSDVSLLRKQNSKLDTDYHEKDKLVNGLKTRLAVCEQESKDKDVLMKKQKELLNGVNEQKQRLEEIIKEKEKNIQSKQSTIHNLTEELVKTTEITGRIKKEMAVINQKLKVRTVIALEQEKVVENSQEKIKELQEVLSSQERKIRSLQETEISLKGSVSELSSVLETKDKKIKDNERLIDWLNRRLTEQSKVGSPTSRTANQFLISGVTSTPYPHLRNQDSNGVPLPHSVVSVSPPTDVRSLDHHENVQAKEIEKSHATTTPVDQQVLSENSNNTKSLDTPKTGETNSKRSVGARSLVKKTSFKTPGFKRSTLSEVQATSVPSSYFLK